MHFRFRVHILSILIALGIIAIFASLYVQYLKPYQHEQQLEKLDAQRIHDIDALDAAVSAALAAQSPQSIATSSAASSTASIVREITARITPKAKNKKSAHPSLRAGINATSTEGMISLSALASAAATSSITLSLPTPQASCARVATSSLPAGWSATCDASTTSFTIISPTPACNDIDPGALPTGWQYACTYPHYVYLSLPSESPSCDGIDLPTLPDGWSYRCAPPSTYTKADGTGWLPLDLTTHGISMLPVDPVNKAATLNYYAYVEDASPTISHTITAALDSEKYLTEKAHADEGVDPSRYERGASELWKIADGIISVWPESSADNTHFDGIFSKVTIPNTPEISQLGKVNQSYGVIIKFRSPVATDQSLVEKWDGTVYPFAIRGPLPHMQFSSYDGKNFLKIATAAKSYSDNKWHVVSAVRDASQQTMAMFVDRSLIGEISDDMQGDINNDSDVYIGNRSSADSKYLTGDIAFVLMYRRSLLPQEIQRIF